MRELPTAVAIEYLHRQLAPDQETFDRIFHHCEIVYMIAEQLIDRSGLAVDKKLVRVGALVHDIGVYLLQPDENYIRHGLIGAKFLQKKGYSPKICRFAACHIGVGISKEDIIKNDLPLPKYNFMPKTTEERLVAYADNFHSKSTPARFDSFDSVVKECKQFGAEHSARLKDLSEEFGLPDLAILSQEFDTPIV